MDQAESKMVIFEYRSGAYLKYVSTGTQEIAICRPVSSGFQTISQIGFQFGSTLEASARHSSP
jgi:hypothetical protein